MESKSNTGNIILGVSAVVLVVGGYLYFRKPTEEELPTEQPKTPSVSGTQTILPPTLPSTNPTGTTTSNPTQKPVNVYSTVDNAIVYKALPKGSIIGGAIGAKIRSVKRGDKIGVFKGYRDIQNYTYILVQDVNSGQPVFIAKSVSKTDL